ncbi:MAG: hypothetical protein QM785_15265 [Pyrinomonadaceae bacterium]
MKNVTFGLIACAALVLGISCRWLPGGTNTNGNSAVPAASPTPTPTPGGGGNSDVKKAYRISGNIDDAHQEGNVCDTSKEFTVPGTLKFKFTPESPTKGTYKYTGGFNARGEGPYEINDDGTMKVDGTGCIMGNNCATYSHKWKATPIDSATCKDEK